MKFLSITALKAKFPDAESIVQVTILTKMRSIIQVEGPVSEVEAAEIIRLSMSEEPGVVSSKQGFGRKLAAKKGQISLKEGKKGL